ncbi:hypothetical protein BV898_02643 [Hypsibius exemplaris]|uniref:Protein kinase domain-containing protein n=1 Tax=Hypsibius exemplaris TaxID=2072580 RepID=A0A1W0X7J6_HYPEX|nr:hypothetical protein BV898_02643 [Hypsibius exemplaris]
MIQSETCLSIRFSSVFDDTDLSQAVLNAIRPQPIRLAVVDRPSIYTKILKDGIAGFKRTTSPANRILLLNTMANIPPSLTAITGAKVLTDADKSFSYHTGLFNNSDSTPVKSPPPGRGKAPIEISSYDRAYWTKDKAPFRVATPDAVLGVVLNNPWTIGYTSLTNIMQANRPIGLALVENNAGGWSNASHWSLRQSIPMNTTTIKADGSTIITNLPKLHDYPFVGMTFIAVRNYSLAMANINSSYVPVNCSLSSELMRYYRWLNRDPLAQARLYALGSVGVPNSTYDHVVRNILMTTWLCTNTSDDAPKVRDHRRHRRSVFTAAFVWDVMMQDIKDEGDYDWLRIAFLYIMPPCLCLTIAYYLVLAIWAWIILELKTRRGKYRIRASDIAFIETSKERYKAMLQTRPFLDGTIDVPFITGEYGSGVVLLRQVDMQFNCASRKVRQELIHLQEWKTHKNLAKFLGVTEIKHNSYIVSELSLLGDLRTLLSNESVRITVPVRYCLAKGVAAGLEYLHSQDIIHGNVRSSSIYVESDWSVRISDWEYVHIFSLQGLFVSKDQTFRQMKHASKELQIMFLSPLLWTAPELLKSVLEQTRLMPSKHGDSFG